MTAINPNTMIDWHHIDTVLLDMDGTLLDLHYDDYFWRHYLAPRVAQLKAEPVAPIAALLEQKFATEFGQLHWYCTDYWSQLLEVDIIALKQELSHKIAPLPHALAFLKQLQASGKRIVMATNAHPDVLNLKMRHIDLSPYFERLISAHQLHAPKEQLQFWQQLQQQLQFDPTCTLLIDDNEIVLNAALEFGITQRLQPGQPNSQKDTPASGTHPVFQCYSELLPCLTIATTTRASDHG